MKSPEVTLRQIRSSVRQPFAPLLHSLPFNTFSSFFRLITYFLNMAAQRSFNLCPDQWLGPSYGV